MSNRIFTRGELTRLQTSAPQARRSKMASARPNSGSLVHRLLDGGVQLGTDQAVADRRPHQRRHRADEPVLLQRRPILRRRQIEPGIADARGLAAHVVER
jgi:hypothetical protein